MSVFHLFTKMNKGTATIDDVQLKPVKLGTDYGKQNPKLTSPQSVSKSSDRLPYTVLTHEDSAHVSVPSITAYDRRTPPIPIADNVLSEINRIFAKRALDLGSYGQCYPVEQAIDDVQLKPVKLGTAYGQHNLELTSPRSVSKSSDHLPYTVNTHEDPGHESVPLITAYDPTPRTPPPTPIANNVLSEIDRIFAKRTLNLGSYGQCHPVAQAFPGRNNNPAYERMEKMVLSLYLIIFASGILFGFYMV